MSKTYGYCRISRKEQNIDRQIRNIKAEYPEAIILTEAFTGRKVEGRKVYEQLCKRVEAGDTIVFDSVSRMSRNATEGWEQYERFYNMGVELVFLKEHHIDTATYKKALTAGVPMTGTDVDCILKGVNEYLMRLAKEQITLAFSQAEKEVEDLRQRTREGIETARLNGKQIGQKEGRKLITEKSLGAMEKIRKYSKSFDGALGDEETMKLAGVSRMTFYKYKKDIAEHWEDVDGYFDKIRTELSKRKQRKG